MQITKEEYEQRKKDYWITELQKVEVKPNGMIASWDFRLRTEIAYTNFKVPSLDVARKMAAGETVDVTLLGEE